MKGIRGAEAVETCSACQGQGAVVVTLGTSALVLCRGCAPEVAIAIQDKMSMIDCSTPTSAEMTSCEVEALATYPFELILDELVTCTVRYRVGPLEADESRIATALLERLATLGIARKVHRDGCKIWPQYKLCSCPWEVPS